MGSIEVRRLAQDHQHLRLTLLAGADGLDGLVTSPRIQKTGLVLTGSAIADPGRIQILGQSEVRYLEGLSERARRKAVQHILAEAEVPCLIVTRGLDPPPGLVEDAEEAGKPLFRTTLSSGYFIGKLHAYLEDKLSTTTTLHGVCVDVFGVGILLRGDSGIGKSECALDLIVRGHRLVADDVVEVVRKPPATLFGYGSDLIKHHMEIRGLGIINIQDLFGVAAIRDRKVIDLVIELVAWKVSDDSYDRTGLEDLRCDVLGVAVPLLRLPVSPGRNVATVVEVAARNYLLQRRGHHSAREFQDQLQARLADRRPSRVHTLPPEDEVAE